jgi:hypothetical protein
MQKIRIMTLGLKPEDATAVVLCNCGSIIVFNALEVREINKKIVECEVCKTQILLVDEAFNEGCI